MLIVWKELCSHSFSIGGCMRVTSPLIIDRVQRHWFKDFNEHHIIVGIKLSSFTTSNGPTYAKFVQEKNMIVVIMLWLCPTITWFSFHLFCTTCLVPFDHYFLCLKSSLNTWVALMSLYGSRWAQHWDGLLTIHNLLTMHTPKTPE